MPQVYLITLPTDRENDYFTQFMFYIVNGYIK